MRFKVELLNPVVARDEKTEKPLGHTRIGILSMPSDALDMFMVHQEQLANLQLSVQPLLGSQVCKYQTIVVGDIARVLKTQTGEEKMEVLENTQ